MVAKTAELMPLACIGAVATRMMPATTEIGNITACSHPRNIGLAASTGATWLSMLREATGGTALPIRRKCSPPSRLAIGASSGDNAHMNDQGDREDVSEFVEHLAFTAVLNDGTPIRVRPIAPKDKQRLAEGWKQLSDHSRYLRFMQSKSTLSESDLVSPHRDRLQQPLRLGGRNPRRARPSRHWDRTLCPRPKRTERCRSRSRCRRQPPATRAWAHPPPSAH